LDYEHKGSGGTKVPAWWGPEAKPGRGSRGEDEVLQKLVLFYVIKIASVT